MGAKGIIEFLIANSKDWLRALHARESKKTLKQATIFPSVHDILAKIQKFCTEKHICLFEEPVKTLKVTAVIAKPEVRVVGDVFIKQKISEITKCKPKTVVKKGTVAVTFSKWTVDEPEFPPLELSKSVHSDVTETLDFGKIVKERSLKSTLDTIDNRSQNQTNQDISSINIDQGSQPEHLGEKSNNIVFNGQNGKNVQRIEVKNLECSDQQISKLKGHLEKTVEDNQRDSIVTDIEVTKDRNSKSLTKNKNKPETFRSQKPSNSHNNSPSRKKNEDSSHNIESIKSSVDKKLNFKDDVSTTESLLTSNLKGSDIDDYISKNQECLTELDIKILESINKSQISFDRSSSRYQFVNETQRAEEQKLKQCHKFSNLIFSFLDENPLKIEDVITDPDRQNKPCTKEFRLFDQSYSLVIPKRST
jgi:hypothetical protein